MAAMVSVEGLGKRYRLGENTAGYGRLTESLSNLVRRRRGRSVVPHGEIWAMRDASFDVAEGEVVGLIGRNGAGKSTLLKLLARVTSPTEGRAEIRGRVGSLLEVGTGFHQELTGRENVFLSGAILGMRRSEIQRKFDEIVAFAEIEAFIDTPVKRYSSGMGLRLGFAVAAFLEPEVLLVDEVLAVGDVRFREKCLGRIGDVSREDGRTVFFVSHDPNAILSTCSRALLIEGGRILVDAPAADAVAAYERSDSASSTAEGEFRRTTPHPRFPRSVFTGARIEPADHGIAGHASHGAPLKFVIETSGDLDVSRFSVDILIRDDRQRPVTYISSVEMQGFYVTPGAVVECTIPYLPLVPGLYHVEFIAQVPGVEPLDNWSDDVAFDVIRFDPFETGSTFVPVADTGNVVPAHSWTISSSLSKQRTSC
jgi:homopolymeric O-antigen transport system ATP-binding protein